MPTRTLFVGDPPPPFFRGTGPAFLDRDLVSMDDEQVKAILLTLGISTLTGPPPGTGPYFSAATDDRHPTHRFLFARWTGQKRASDNGYAMLGWLKTAHSFKETEVLMKQFVEANAHVASIRFIPEGLGS